MNGESKSLLKPAYTKQDLFVAVISLLVCFGEGVESYLPGVITQYVSCDIGVGDFQEGLLACIFYLTLAIGIILGGTIANVIGERKLLLASLYLSCLASVACAVVGNYWTLLLSRALIGFCVGLSFIIAVFTAKFCSSHQLRDAVLFIGYLGYNLGGAYIGVLGYFLLEYAGWRVFVLFTSLPLFVLPIFLLHSEFTLPSTNAEQLDANTSVSEDFDGVRNILKPKEPRTLTACLKIFQMSLFKFAILHTGKGTILLLPSLLQVFHISQAVEGSDPCENITKGSDFLILAVAAAFSAIGRTTGYWLRNSPNFRVYLIVPSLVMVVSYCVMLLENSLSIIIMSSVITKFTYAHSAMLAGFIFYDERYFKNTGLNLTIGSSIIMGVAIFGAVSGSIIAAFASAFVGVAVALAMSCVVLTIAMLFPGTFHIE